MLRLLLKTLIVCAIVFLPVTSQAACMNKFLRRTEGPRQVITLLTGRLTFQEAQALAAAISSHEKPPLEWVDAKGKAIARQWGELKIVRPMPVGCDGKPSGVVMIATFATTSQPSRKMDVKIDGETVVNFEEQSQ